MTCRKTERKILAEVVVAKPGEKWDPVTELNKMEDDTKFIMRVKTDGTVEQLVLNSQFISSRLVKAAIPCRAFEPILMDKAKLSRNNSESFVHMLVDEAGLQNNTDPNGRATELVRKYCSRGFVYPIVGDVILTLYLI